MVLAKKQKLTEGQKVNTIEIGVFLFIVYINTQV